MDKQKVDFYIMGNSKYFPQEKLVYLKEKLLNLDEDKFSLISTVELKDPTTITIVSVLIGGLGIDRFMIGDSGMGVLKLLTGGVCGVLTIVDWCTIGKKTRELNFQKIIQIL